MSKEIQLQASNARQQPLIDISVVKENIHSYIFDKLGFASDDCLNIAGHSVLLRQLFADVDSFWMNSCQSCATFIVKTACSPTSSQFDYISYHNMIQDQYIKVESIQQYQNNIYDNGKIIVACCSNKPETKPPIRCHLSAGSHYPLRGQIVYEMQKAIIKLSESKADYTINFGFCIENVGHNVNHIPVSYLEIILDGQKCSDLRKIMNHENQYNKLLSVFEKRNYLESHSYLIDMDECGNISKRKFNFNFKMIEPDS